MKINHDQIEVIIGALNLVDYSWIYCYNNSPCFDKYMLNTRLLSSLMSHWNHVITKYFYANISIFTRDMGGISMNSVSLESKITNICIVYPESTQIIYSTKRTSVISVLFSHVLFSSYRVHKNQGTCRDTQRPRDHHDNTNKSRKTLHGGGRLPTSLGCPLPGKKLPSS